ncbi:MAG TPA: S8 family serine peptidase [Rudaea sp.]|nr:S8 family serine peptidase [Rudaea sp.]
MATRKKAPSATVPDAQYVVRGFIVHLGRDLSPKKRKAALQRIRAQVPELAHAVDARALDRARPLGKGAADVLIALPRQHAVDIREAWNVVHALRRNALVADAEPAVRTASGVAPPEGKRFAAIGGPEGPPLPQASTPRWSVDNARISDEWPATRGYGVLVGHPDTGYTHNPQIDNARLLAAYGYNFQEGNADPLDRMSGSYPGHGTATASVIMADAQPVYGAALEARLIPYRVSDSVIHFDFTNLTQALYRARDQQCDLVSMSLGGPWAGRALSRAVDTLVAADIILLAAAGNVWPWVVYPAKFDNVVAVAASNAIDKPWKDSASGDEVDISAPGESVWRAWSQKINGAMDYSVAPSSGTSYAVATAAGACALWLSLHGAAALRARYPGRVAAVFMDLLKSAGFRSIAGWKTGSYGPGILDAAALLAAPLPAQAPAAIARVRSAVATSQRSYAWARLQPFFPELSPEKLARSIVPAFGKRPATAARQLADVIDEVEFFVATSPEVRRSVIAGAQPPKRGRSAIAAESPRAMLRSVGSAHLRAKLKG